MIAIKVTIERISDWQEQKVYQSWDQAMNAADELSLIVSMLEKAITEIEEKYARISSGTHEVH